MSVGNLGGGGLNIFFGAEIPTKFSQTRKRAQTRTFESGYFRRGRGLPCEGVGGQKFGISPETREIKLFRRDIPGFCRDIPALPEKSEKKKFVFRTVSNATLADATLVL